MTVSSEVPRRRFIAGAVCPQCQALDRLVLEVDANNQEQRRHCVACGFSELMQAKSARNPWTASPLKFLIRVHPSISLRFDQRLKSEFANRLKLGELLQWPIP